MKKQCYKVTAIIKRTGKIYNRNVIIPKNCEYAAAIGAGII